MNIGQKIKNLRVQNGLTQEELADRCQLSKGFISQLENDLTSPSIHTLVDVLTVLGTNLNEFFSDKRREQVVFTKDDVSIKEEEFGSVSWLIPSAQKFQMEPIIVELMPGTESYEYEPNESEMFGYVLAGTISLYLGERKLKIKKGESFYFAQPKVKCVIQNNGRSNARFIWVSNPPIF